MNTTVRFLRHPSSQPCRAVQQFMLETGIPFVEEIVDISNGDNEQQDFKEKLNQPDKFRFFAMTISSFGKVQQLHTI